MPETQDLTGYKYKGEDVICLVEIEDELGEKTLVRPFDQTNASHSITADEMEVTTKDRAGTDYGEITEARSFEGELVYDDPFIPAMKKAMRNKKFVKIYEVDLITKKAEYGMHMINAFDLEYSHGDFATYSLDANLFGNPCETTLTEIPEGAPPLGGMDCDGSEDIDDGGVEG